MSILAAAVAGLMMTLLIILVLDLMDSSLRSAEKTAEQTGLEVEAIFPVIAGKKQKIDVGYLEKKGTEAISRKLILHSLAVNKDSKPTSCFAFSTRDHEGKSFLLHRISAYMGKIGHKVLMLLPHDSPDTESSGYDLAKYIISDNFYRISSLWELEIPGFKPDWKNYDFIFVEFPGVLHSSFPVNLFKIADHFFLVCSANRSWSKADANILAEILAVTDPVKPKVLLNRVAVEEMESVVGDLPRKRSWLRKLVKRIITRQFLSGKVD
jgi:hypothetical protein